MSCEGCKGRRKQREVEVDNLRRSGIPEVEIRKRYQVLPERMQNRLAIDNRRAMCLCCEHSGKGLNRDGRVALATFSKCDVCDCPIAGKTAAKEESCPLKKW